jgi:protein SCO1
MTLRHTLAACLLVLAGCRKSAESNDGVRRLPHYDSPDFTPRWNVASREPSFHTIRPFRLVSQRGEPFTEKELLGKITIADFFFTRCRTLCPKLALSMRKLQTRFRDDDRIVLISHSVTPDSDTVPVLQAYAEENSVDFRRWKLLTGARAEIYDLGRKFYFVEEDMGVEKGADEFLHTENFVLLDGHLHLRGIYNSLDPSSMEALVADVEVLELEPD